MHVLTKNRDADVTNRVRGDDESNGSPCHRHRIRKQRRPDKIQTRIESETHQSHLHPNQGRHKYIFHCSSHFSPVSSAIVANHILNLAAQKYVLCQYNIPRSLQETATRITPGKRAPTITGLDDPDWAAVSSMVLKESIAGVMDELTSIGSTDILVLDIANSRTVP